MRFAIFVFAAAALSIDNVPKRKEGGPLVRVYFSARAAEKILRSPSTQLLLCHFLQNEPKWARRFSYLYLHHRLPLSELDRRSAFEVVKFAWKSNLGISPQQCDGLPPDVLAVIYFQHLIRGKGQLARVLLSRSKSSSKLLARVAGSTVPGLFTADLIKEFQESLVPPDAYYPGYFGFAESDEILKSFERLPYDLKRAVSMTIAKRSREQPVTSKDIADTIALRDEGFDAAKYIGREYTKDELLHLGQIRRDFKRHEALRIFHSY